MPAKVTDDSLLIHEFTCSLFIGLCSVTSNMTGCSHSYHLMKLINCGSPQRDVLSDKMVFWVVTHSFYFMLCQSYLLSTVISFVYKDKWWWLIFFYFMLCQSSLLSIVISWAASWSHLTCGPLSYSEILWRVIFRYWLNGHVDYSTARSSWHTLNRSQLVPIELFDGG